MNLQDDTLNNFIAAKQWKQAFNLCEKKLKKAPGSDYLLVTKIKILIFWEDPTRFQQGLKDLESLFERKPPVADIEALCALDMVLEAFADPGHLSTKQKQTWQRAAVSRPQDAKLHSKWYRTKFDEGDFKGAQQVNAPVGKLNYYADLDFALGSSNMDEELPTSQDAFLSLHSQHPPNLGAKYGRTREDSGAGSCL